MPDIASSLALQDLSRARRLQAKRRVSEALRPFLVASRTLPQSEVRRLQAQLQIDTRWDRLSTMASKPYYQTSIFLSVLVLLHLDIGQRMPCHRHAAQRSLQAKAHRPSKASCALRVLLPPRGPGVAATMDHALSDAVAT